MRMLQSLAPLSSRDVVGRPSKIRKDVLLSDTPESAHQTSSKDSQNKSAWMAKTVIACT